MENSNLQTNFRGIKKAFLIVLLVGLVLRLGLFFDYQPISFGSNLLFIVTSALALFWKKLSKVWNIRPMLWLMATTIWATFIIHTLLDHGDIPRFLVPVQSIVIFWVLWIIYHSWFILKQERA